MWFLRVSRDSTAITYDVVPQAETFASRPRPHQGNADNGVVVSHYRAVYLQNN